MSPEDHGETQDADAPYGPMEDRVYDAYQDERSKLLGAEQEYGRNFDKYLLTLSGGALGLSLTFISSVVTPGKVYHGWLLGLAWGLLVLTVVLVMVMIRFGQVGFERFRDLLDEECSKGGARFGARVRRRQDECWQPKAIGSLNWISLGAFAAAIISLFLFTLINLSAGNGGQTNA